MAQYFKLVNVDRQEYVCAKCLGLEGRLREWVLNPHGALLILLMRKSDKTGGGDVTTEQVVLDPFKHKLEDVAEMWARCYSREGVALYLPEDSVIGLWANQSVCVIGDYDESHLFEGSNRFANITKRVVKEWNEFVGFGGHQLHYKPCGCPGDEV